MLTHLQWLRARRRWICYGVGVVCSAGLALQGCSRSQMSRFKELTSAPAASSDDAPVDSTGISGRDADRPRSTDAVADSAAGRKSLFGGGRNSGRDAASRYRDEYAEVSRKVLERSRESSRDPFLNQPDSPSTKPFPSTDELANVAQAGAPRRPAGADPVPGVVRTASSADRAGVIDPASRERTQPPGVAHTGADPNAGASRLEELRAELRRQQAASQDARQAAAGGINTAPGPNDRGYGLSVQPADSPAVVKLVANQAEASAEAPPQVAPPPTPNSGSEEIWLRVQSLLAAAEWLADRGDLEEAYRNAMLAQHLTDHAGLQLKAGDRHPSEVGQRIWVAMNRREDSIDIARQLPKPRLPSGAQSQPLPNGTFPIQDRLGWTKTDGPSSLIADANAMPVIVPRPGAAPPAATPPAGVNKTPAAGQPIANARPAPPAAQPAPAAPLAQAKAAPPAVAKAPPQPPAKGGPRLPGGPKNPVSLAAIESSPDTATPPQPPVVTALAETPAAPNAAAGAAEPAGFTVPAMATLPRNAAPPNPAGPALARAPRERVAPAPPNLEVVAARRLQAAAAQTEPRRRFPGVIWGLGGLAVGIVGAVVWTRRRRQSAAPTSSR